MVFADDAFGAGFLNELAVEVTNGYVRRQVHPDDSGLSIFNYAEKTVFERRWNRATLNARGLILADDGEIIARPFQKFFNSGEASAPVFDLDDEVEVTDKMDGSLGIGYMAPDGRPAVATRGSFASDQAIHATELLRSNPEYERWATTFLLRRFTPTWEIVFPENRIVCDYGDMDDLVYLALIQNSTGESRHWHFNWPGPKTTTFDYTTFRRALEAEPRPGAEGFVVRKVGTEDRVKLKQEDYVLLHRVVTNLNERAVWEVVKDRSQDTWAWIAQLPDEFHDWAKKVADDLRGEFRKIEADILDEYEAIKMVLEIQHSVGWGRKEFAHYAVTSPYAWAHFALLDDNFYGGKYAVYKIWDMIKPEANKGPHGKKVEDA